MPGVLYTAGVQHAKNVAKAFADAGIDARAVSGETPKRELAEILAGFERGEVDVLCNAMLLAEGRDSSCVLGRPSWPCPAAGKTTVRLLGSSRRAFATLAGGSAPSSSRSG